MKNKITIDCAYKLGLSSKEKKSIVNELVKLGYTRTGLNILDDDAIYKLAKKEDLDMVMACNW